MKDFLQHRGLEIAQEDFSRPWGGFFMISDNSSEEFLKIFYPEIEYKKLIINKISPKILLVAPGKRLSWQYHHRRSERWKLYEGEAGIIRSLSDEEGEMVRMIPGETVELAQGERHRLVGLEKWGIIAEIWQHTDADNPSDEEDIVRLQDDFGR